MTETETITDMLEARGIGPGDAAARAGVGRVSLWRWTNGVAIPRIPQAKALARVLQRRGERLDDLTQRIIDASRRARAPATIN